MSVTRQTENEITINLGSLFFSFWKHRKLIISLALAGACIGLLLAFVKSLEQTDQIKASIAVTSVNSAGVYMSAGNSDVPSTAEFQLEKDILQPTVYLITSDRVLDRVVKALDLNASIKGKLKSSFAFQQYKDTQILDITLYWNNSQDGIRIMQAVLDALPDTLIGTLDIGGIQVLNTPALKTSGTGINLKLLAVLGLAGGLAGALYVVLRHIIRPTLIDANDVRERFNVELLGNVLIEKIDAGMYNELLLNQNNRFSVDFEQSYAYMAHLIDYKLQQKQQKMFFLTSCYDAEGKTTSAIFLAIQLSYFRNKILLIDFDVKHPRLGKFFLDSVPHDRSLNAVFANETLPRDAVVHLTSYLDILPTRVERRNIRLTDAIFDKIRSLSEDYDLVVIDAAPVGMMMDVLNLSDLTKECVFMISQDNASQKVIGENIADLQRVGFDILGCIVSHVSPMLFFREKRYGYGRDAEAPVELTEKERKAKERKINEERYQFRRRQEILEEADRERREKGQGDD
ncbi:MAG: Wzz/FepE/Etk N-terminal domain-containing protein, partial [Aliarcobacter cryaerophilus]|nr:Wzz/FepE/Etk N-terminal domain-containing protein [Aliarcobacter cryaerophilus]